MTTNEIKQYLKKKLPDFEFKTSDLEANENKLWIERDGQHMVLEVSKVENKKGAKKLKEFIEIKWKELDG